MMEPMTLEEWWPGPLNVARLASLNSRGGISAVIAHEFGVHIAVSDIQRSGLLVVVPIRDEDRRTRNVRRAAPGSPSSTSAGRSGS